MARTGLGRICHNGRPIVAKFCNCRRCWGRRNQTSFTRPNFCTFSKMDNIATQPQNAEDGSLREPPAEGTEHVAVRRMAKHTIGLFLLALVVFMWTACNFLGSVRTDIPFEPVRTQHNAANRKSCTEHFCRCDLCQTLLPHVSKLVDFQLVVNTTVGGGHIQKDSGRDVQVFCSSLHLERHVLALCC